MWNSQLGGGSTDQVLGKTFPGFLHPSPSPLERICNQADFLQGSSKRFSLCHSPPPETEGKGKCPSLCQVGNSLHLGLYRLCIW